MMKPDVADDLKQTFSHVGDGIRPDQIWQAGDSITAFAQV